MLAKKDGAIVKYKLKYLPEGKYTVYAWNTGENLTVSKEGENEWFKIGEYTQKESGKFNYTRKVTNAGERVDAIMLIKDNNN